MMEPGEEKGKKKGTVTSLSSLFSADEAQKASQRVQGTITEKQQQLNQLKGFVSDNTNLINLVQRLPDELHHEIMVPFGKAAFFPGRLIHTNEFMVLLGEGYYAERTSKQTIDILKRRGKALESQVESLKAVMQDLKVEASFFEATASEAYEGLVEIREDYVEEASSSELSTGVNVSDSCGGPEADNTNVAHEDDEYSRILSRMAELEKEEEEAENASQSEDDLTVDNVDDNITQVTIDPEVRSGKVNTLSNQIKRAKENEGMVKGLNQNSYEDFPSQLQAEEFPSQLQAEGLELEVQVPIKGGTSKDKGPTVGESSLTTKPVKLPKPENVQTSSTTKNEAFTGSIVEHTHNIDLKPRDPTVGRSSKPVSRFKMQRK